MIDSKNLVLFESMLAAGGLVFLGARHLRRLYESAKSLGFPTDRLEAFKAVMHLDSMSESQARDLREYAFSLESLASFDFKNPICKNLWMQLSSVATLEIDPAPSMLRLKLNRLGQLAWEVSSLSQSPSNRIFLASTPLPSNAILLCHKTSSRECYDLAASSIARGECFDIAYFNEEGALREGSRSSIVVRLDSGFYTPPKSSGLLPGTLRGLLLDCKICEEKRLGRVDILRAKAIFCANSVRGIVEVSLK